jgi:hypothetical protein
MNKRRLRLARTLLATSFLTACATATSDAPPPPQACPAWPVAGPQVAGELQHLGEDEFPAFWEWMARLDKLRDQLEVAR